MNEVTAAVLSGILANPNINPLDTRIQGAAIKAAQEIVMAMYQGPVFTPSPGVEVSAPTNQPQDVTPVVPL